MRQFYSPKAIEFEWRVCTDGYRWVDQDGVRLIQPAPSKSARIYQLAEYPALFKTLAATEPTEDGVKAFADKYGLLLDGKDAGESLTMWRREILTLRLAIDLVEASKSRDTVRVRAILGEVTETLDYEPEIIRGFAEVPLALVRQFADRRFDRYVTARCVSPSPTLASEFEYTRLNYAFSARCLLGAVWLQFLAAVERGVEFRVCPQCGELFEASRQAATGRRRDAVYHSTKCKQAAYRARIEDAQRLSHEGVELQEIAKQLGTRVPRIRRWLARERAVERSAKPAGRKNSRRENEI